MDATTLELPPDTLPEVLTMIDRRAWGLGREQLLLVVWAEAAQTEDGWCRLGRRALARKAHINERWCYEQLHVVTRAGAARGAYLTAGAHVLLRGDRGAGTRGDALRINPNLRAWRVPWAVGPDELELRLAVLEEHILTYSVHLQQLSVAATAPQALASGG